jgi:hypothetical protein
METSKMRGKSYLNKLWRLAAARIHVGWPYYFAGNVAAPKGV